MTVSRIRMTQRRARLLSAREKNVQRVAAKILPVLQRQYKALDRHLRRGGNLRKRLQKIKGPDGIIAYPADDLHNLARYKVNQFLQSYVADAPPKDNWEDWKKALLVALLAALVLSVDDFGDIENDVWESRGFDPLTFDPEQVIRDYQLRTGYDLTQLGEDTMRDAEQMIANWYESDRPFSDLMAQLNKYFNEARADRIARSEVANTLSQVVLQELISNNWREWYWDALGENPCQQPIILKGTEWEGCRDLNGHIFQRGDPMPPGAAHNGCQCLPTPKVA